MNSNDRGPSVIVVGVNGRLGAAAARACVAAGFRVTGFARSERQKIAGMRFVAGDADDVAALGAAVAGHDFVLNALNLPYDRWFDGRAEAQLERLLEAIGRAPGCTLLFPGNIYNYAADERTLTPETPARPQTPRGEIRVRLEASLEAAVRRGDLRAIVLRAGDYYGPGGSDWFDQLILREAAKGRVALAAHEQPHAWAYLPDLARAFVRLAERSAELEPFATFHFAGHFVSAGQMFRAIEAVAGRKLRRVPTPWLVLRMMGLFQPVLREVVKMRYLWENPMELVDPRLDQLLGPDFATSFEAAMAETVAPSFATVRRARSRAAARARDVRVPASG